MDPLEVCLFFSLPFACSRPIFRPLCLLLVVLAQRIHPFPSRTRSLSSAARMVLPRRLGGRVRRCQHICWAHPSGWALLFCAPIRVWRRTLPLRSGPSRRSPRESTSPSVVSALVGGIGSLPVDMWGPLPSGSGPFFLATEVGNWSGRWPRALKRPRNFSSPHYAG